MSVQYEIKQKVIEPKRLAFDYLLKRYGNRQASRYEEQQLISSRGKTFTTDRLGEKGWKFLIRIIPS
ncbi:hypothetical protein [Candidatus Kryptobacter tengchongensis]|uniref:Uncharacterized protein n=1 Tax=Kryptobacter tengchongensis TaxID=1643429 RepID=A0A656D9Z5_KRYT1|nr:hypothetical protein [Candidatus Kryptobacter tengchongensis]CUT02715.1 hypothetical protein JGI24_01174 [Candidatus Kryptobacter tengchongensis]